MNCNDLQNSLAERDGGMSPGEQIHLKSCPACLDLVADFERISSVALELRSLDEPSPRVWNSLQIALRQEGLIRPQLVTKPFSTSFGARWGRARWLVPAAAALLIAVGIVEYRNSSPTQRADRSLPSPIATVADLNDDDLVQEVADRSPAVRAQYADGLRSVNDAIRDAQGSLDSDPADQEARRSLMEAYQQKQMLFEMAEDRPLP